MIPLVLIGSLFGTLIASVLPEIILTFLLILLLLYLLYDSINKSCKLWKKETKEKENQAKIESASAYKAKEVELKDQKADQEKPANKDEV